MMGIALAVIPPGMASDIESNCVTPEAVPAFNSSALRNYGMVLYRAVDMVDVFGTLDPLQLMAHSVQQMNLYFIAETLEPVTTETQSAAMNPHNSSFWPVITPTHTFADDLDLDVLIVPGGPGMRAPDMEPVTDYLARMYPRVKLFMTVCTGAGLAAKAGVLDGKLATTNKNAWDEVTAMGPEVRWVSPARYVMDGKTWSSSGVSLLLLSPLDGQKLRWCCRLPRRLTSSLPSSRRTGALTVRILSRVSLNTSPGLSTMIRSRYISTLRPRSRSAPPRREGQSMYLTSVVGQPAGLCYDCATWVNALESLHSNFAKAKGHVSIHKDLVR